MPEIKTTDSGADTAASLAGDHAILARRYASSLYALAETEGVTDAVAADLRGLRRLWDECSEWRMIAVDPRLSQVEVTAAAAQVVKGCSLSKLASNFVLVVAQNRRLSVLPAMIAFFLEEVATRRGEYHADVRTAHTLTLAQRDALIASLSAVMGGKINLTVVEDASILGGLTIKVGSQFIDASIKTRLDLLERSLKAGAVA